jgi:hypothetical protein
LQSILYFAIAMGGFITYKRGLYADFDSRLHRK